GWASASPPSSAIAPEPRLASTARSRAPGRSSPSPCSAASCSRAVLSCSQDSTWRWLSPRSPAFSPRSRCSLSSRGPTSTSSRETDPQGFFCNCPTYVAGREDRPNATGTPSAILTRVVLLTRQVDTVAVRTGTLHRGVGGSNRRSLQSHYSTIDDALFLLLSLPGVKLSTQESPA